VTTTTSLITEWKQLIEMAESSMKAMEERFAPISSLLQVL